MRFAPGLTNVLMRLAKPALRALGFVDLPHVSVPKSPGQPAAASTTGNTVVLLEDTFLGTFDGSVIDACQSLLETLGYEVLRHSPVPNGKAQHVFGFRAAFAKAAAKRMALIDELSRNGHPLIGIEPSVQAMETSEYRVLGKVHDTHSFERFLEAEIVAGRIAENTVNVDAETWLLFSHCTEKTSDPLSIQRWKFIFAHFGLKLEARATGCCGMAGTFGHEREHADMSETLYDLSWRAPIAAANGRALATGFSCRCQIERFSKERVPHPVELLAKALKR